MLQRFREPRTRFWNSRMKKNALKATNRRRGRLMLTYLRTSIMTVAATVLTMSATAAPLPPDASYRPLPSLPFDAVKANDETEKPTVMRRQEDLLNERCDLSDRPIPRHYDVGRAQTRPGWGACKTVRWHYLG